MNAEKVKVAAVSYLNTKPLLYGFKDHPVKEKTILTIDYPSRIAAQLINKEVDVALVPVAVIPQLKEHHIIADYCIGAEEAVASVCLFSEVPMNEIERVYLDYQSRSSVALTRVLLKNYWNVSPELIHAEEGYEKRVGGRTAGVIIGDRALQLRKNFRYIYDLAEAWIDFTGLPFVFAAWVSNKQLPEDYINQFNEATGFGTQGEALEKVLMENHCDFIDLREYYTRHISYSLTGRKLQGLEEFLALLRQMKPLPTLS